MIGLRVETPDTTVQVGDSLQLVARAVNAGGDTVTDALILWSIIDVDSGQIGFTLDSTTGVLVGVQAGSGRVQARFDDIRSDPILVTVASDASARAAAMLRTRRYWDALIPG